MQKKVAINCCGIHVGGGIQVATSFIDELCKIIPNDLEVYVFASSEITENLKKIKSTAHLSPLYITLNTYGLSAFFSKLNRELEEFSLVFTIFGPNYLKSQNNIQIVGFAQSWIIDNSAYHILNFKDRLKSKAKFFIQSIFFRRADKLIVELEHVKKGLVKSGIAKENNIEVVHNCISSLYLNPNIWEPLSNKIQKKTFAVGYIGRDYSHKNTKILPLVKKILKNKHGLNVDFYVTFNESEWSKKSSDFRDNIFNIGTLSVAQCPNFYEAVDAVIFPSLLECFSATPLEAMAMKKPLFASDRGFVRDVCREFAFYFDPLCANSAADSIAEYINNRSANTEYHLSAAREHVLNFSSARGRALRYVEIIRNTLAERDIKF